MQDDIINDYKKGIDVEEILNKYDITFSKLYTIVCPILKYSVTNISDSDASAICDMYKNGLSTTKIGIKVGIYHKVVANILETNGIKRTNNGKRKWHLNETYFDEIDTPNKAYILGLLYADGYNSLDKGTVCISLEKTDRELLEKIRIELGSEKPLQLIKCEDHVASNGYVSNDMYKLTVYSMYMCRTLEKYGVFQNKSLILEFPTWLDKTLINHFVRGYFDGDGSYCHHKVNRKTSKMAHYQDVVTFTSTYDFCNELLSILRNNGTISGGGVYDASNHNGITAVLSISGRRQIMSLFNWMYKDAELYMARKYNKLVSCLEA